VRQNGVRRHAIGMKSLDRVTRPLDVLEHSTRNFYQLRHDEVQTSKNIPPPYPSLSQPSLNRRAAQSKVNEESREAVPLTGASKRRLPSCTHQNPFTHFLDP
jgi:hypothetical protein